MQIGNLAETIKTVSNNISYIKGNDGVYILNAAGEKIARVVKVIEGGAATGGQQLTVATSMKAAGEAAAVASTSLSSAIMSTLAAAGLFITAAGLDALTPTVHRYIDESIDAKKYKLTENYDIYSLYTGYETNAGISRRFLPNGVSNAIMRAATDAKMFGVPGVYFGQYYAYDMISSPSGYGGVIENYLFTNNNPNYAAFGEYITNCMNKVKTDAHLSDNDKMFLTFAYRPGRISTMATDDRYLNLAIYCAPGWSGKLNFSTYNQIFINPTTIPEEPFPNYGVPFLEWIADEALQLFNFVRGSSTYTRSTRQSDRFIQDGYGYMANVNIAIPEEVNPPYRGELDPKYNAQTWEIPDPGTGLDEWLTENGETAEKGEDADENVFIQINPAPANPDPATDPELAPNLRKQPIDLVNPDYPEQIEKGTEELEDGAKDTIGDPGTIDPPTPAPNPTPVFPPPSLPAASGLFSIYNPTLAQVKSFSQWLWSSDFIDQILKVFSDPMDAIVGFHYLYATPQVSGTDSIRVGYLDSHVSSNICSNQYVTIDCGTINCYEYYGSALDYAPYTKLTLFLPFVGFVDLDTQVYMGGQINVQIIVDILTGCFTANVYSIKNSQKRLCDSYSGSCSVQLPYSSGSYMQAISSITTAAVGGIGGGLPGVAAGVAGAVLGGQIRTQTKHGGSITGNSGSMGVKKPYLIIDRNTPKLPVNYNKTQGFPASTSGKLSDFKGYTRIKDCHLDEIPATDAEKDQIMQLLKNGVIV